MASTIRSERGEPRPGDLTPQHHQLVTQHRELDILRVKRRTQRDQIQHPSDDHERQRAAHHDDRLASPHRRSSQPYP
jgi:hypothetical protein